MRTNITVAIPAPAMDVWNTLADFGGMAKWCPDLALSTQVAGRGLQPGAVRDLVLLKPRGKMTGIRERVTACGEGWFEYVLDGGVGPYDAAGSRWRVTGDDARSNVTVHSYITGGNWWAMLMSPLVIWQLRRGLKRALIGLRQQIAKQS